MSHCTLQLLQIPERRNRICPITSLMPPTPTSTRTFCRQRLRSSSTSGANGAARGRDAGLMLEQFARDYAGRVEGCKREMDKNQKTAMACARGNHVAAVQEVRRRPKLRLRQRHSDQAVDAESVSVDTDTDRRRCFRDDKITESSQLSGCLILALPLRLAHPSDA